MRPASDNLIVNLLHVLQPRVWGPKNKFSRYQWVLVWCYSQKKSLVGINECGLWYIGLCMVISLVCVVYQRQYWRTFTRLVCVEAIPALYQYQLERDLRYYQHCTSFIMRVLDQVENGVRQLEIEISCNQWEGSTDTQWGLRFFFSWVGLGGGCGEGEDSNEVPPSPRRPQ
jgi:hypothetical protein